MANDEKFTGHGSEWRDSNLSEADALTATSWVEAKIDKRSMLTNKDRVHDIRDVMWQLEKEGEIKVHRNTNHVSLKLCMVGIRKSRRGSFGTINPAASAAIFRAIPHHYYG